ncbi:MAG: GNAT family N-acetyltransferase, partial [Spirochaetaceae bacterium]|nr:GNAT family N-acetyltransferase [Spirochaetaceae bacterium]
MKAIALRPAERDRDFARLAVMFSTLEDSANTESSLKEYFDSQKAQTLQKAAFDQDGAIWGFYWTIREITQPDRASVALFVDPGMRSRGLGRFLYADLEAEMRTADLKTLYSEVPDDNPDSRAFAERRGYSERSHSQGWKLDLGAFDDGPFDQVIERLRGEGMRFTSMAELGDGDEARRSLYELNETTSMETMGSDGSRSWTSYEDFRDSVCESDWYDSAGQMVAIDTATGTFAAMSAISRFGDYAYNLHTGVDSRYRGRKLGRAIKISALRYARETLKVREVR